MINPNNDQLIKDLLEDNRSDFATISALEHKAKEYEGRLIREQKSAKTDEDYMKCLNLSGKIIGIYSLIRVIKNDIRKRLEEVDKIRGCKHGA